MTFVRYLVSYNAWLRGLDLWSDPPVAEFDNQIWRLLASNKNSEVMNLNLVGDLHTHTVASGHGYSTVMEIAQVAKRKTGVVAITDHSPEMPGGPLPIYFESHGHFPREIAGVKIYFGVEADILDEKGNLALDEKLLKKLDIVIVSFHPQIFPPASREINTQALLRAIENPLVDIIAHPGNPRYPLDYERVVEAAVSRGKVIEINIALLQ